MTTAVVLSVAGSSVLTVAAVATGKNWLDTPRCFPDFSQSATDEGFGNRTEWATWYWSAPPKYLGDQGVYYGRELWFELRSVSFGATEDELKSVLKSLDELLIRGEFVQNATRETGWLKRVRFGEIPGSKVCEEDSSGDGK